MNSQICFSPIDNQCFSVPSSGTLAAIKLIHARGYVACNDTYLTFWGCGGNKDVNIVIKKATGDDRNIKFHPTKFSTEKEEHTGSLRTPRYGQPTRELVLSSLSNPPDVTGGQRLCLPYLEATNAGKSCCDVYVRFT